MQRLSLPDVVQWGRSLLGAVVFYTTLPLPGNWRLEFERVARWAPLIGLLMGGLLGLLDVGLHYYLGMPVLTRSALIVALWVVFTGGLHLDGAIDTADGFAVADQKRRLEVMSDSTVGAFGVMAAVILLGLKTVALSEISSYRWLALMASAGWGRWGQVMAIALYPYLKQTGKGAFHKPTIRSLQDSLGGLLLLLGLSGLGVWLAPEQWWIWLGIAGAGGAIAWGLGVWFHRQLGGHTGDTYGAVVEWSEALLLCLLASMIPNL